MEIEVFDFQAIRHAKLQCEGFTVITGPSNVGKTALVRAIHGAIFGKSGDYYVRDGENACKVRIVDPDTKVVWQRVKKKKLKQITALNVNGQIHTRLGRDHAELTEPAGFVQLPTKQGPLQPQFHLQHQPIYLIDGTDTTVAEVFKLLGRADVVTDAQKAVQRDQSQTKSKRKVREDDLVVARAKFEKYDTVPKLRKDFDFLQRDATKTLARTGELKNLLENVRTVRNYHQSKVPDLPDLNPSYFYVLFECQRRLARLKQLSKGKVLPKIDDLEVGYYKIVDNNATLNRLRLIKTHLESNSRDRTRMAEITGEMQTVEVRLQAAWREMARCPTCHQVIEGDYETHYHDVSTN